MNEENTQNFMSLKINHNDTLFRLFCESDEIIMNVRDKSNDKEIGEWKSLTMTHILDAGHYEIKMEFSTEVSKQKANLIKNSFQFTIMISSQQFFKDRYLQSQGSALKNCQGNTNFPLGLSKSPQLQTSEHDIVYNYPFMRLSQSTLAQKFEVDSYSFRINETSRFHFQIGTHLFASHVILRLSELKNVGNSYIGKQEFTLNVLDLILSPGDYTLLIEQPQLLRWDFSGFSHFMDWLALYTSDTQEAQKKPTMNMCSLFSLYGRITPVDELNLANGQGEASCKETRNVLPNKLYGSLSETKDGQEFYINSEGTFYQQFDNILIRKTKNSLIIPDFDRIEVSAPHDGLLSILLQYKKKHNEIIVKLFDSHYFTDTAYTPIISHSIEASNDLIEETVTFKMQ